LGCTVLRGEPATSALWLSPLSLFPAAASERSPFALFFVALHLGQVVVNDGGSFRVISK